MLRARLPLSHLIRRMRTRWHKLPVTVVIEQLAAITSEQAGLVSTAQAARVGVDAAALFRLARSGVLERPLRGVYRVRAAPPPANLDVLAAWVLLVGDRLPFEPLGDGQPTVVVSHTAAARILGLGTFPADRPTFIVLRSRHDPPSGSYRTFTLGLLPEEWRWQVLADHIRVAVATPERTLVDLAWAEADPEHVREALTRHAANLDREQLWAIFARRLRRGGRTTRPECVTTSGSTHERLQLAGGARGGDRGAAAQPVRACGTRASPSGGRLPAPCCAVRRIESQPCRARRAERPTRALPVLTGIPEIDDVPFGLGSWLRHSSLPRRSAGSSSAIRTGRAGAFATSSTWR